MWCAVLCRCDDQHPQLQDVSLPRPELQVQWPLGAALCALWLQCGQADSLCLTQHIITICQVLLGLTLLAYLNVLSDLFTQNIRQLVAVADTEAGLVNQVSQVRDRLRALLVCGGNNSVTPVEEINLGGNTGNNTTAVADQNNSVMKDHIRYIGS